MSCAGDIIRILANQNIAECIELIHSKSGFDTHRNKPVDFNDLRKMKNVKSLRLVNFGLQTDEFICQLLKNLAELYECTIENDYRLNLYQPFTNLVKAG